MENTVTITMDILQLEVILQALQHSADTYFQAHFYAKGNEAMRLCEMLRNAKSKEPVESWGTLEGAEQYLTQQRNIAFLALYRLQDEPFMPKRMKANLEDQAIARCGDSGAALDVVRECLKLSRQPEEAGSRL